MLKIRLSRGGSHKRPFFRIVLTEHSKPVKSGYKEVLGRYNPLAHQSEANIDLIKEWIGKGAQPSNRVAKILYKLSEDEFFKDYIVYSDRVRKKKNAPEEEEAPAEAAPAVEEAKDEAPAEETKDEAPAEEAKDEAPAEEAKDEAPAEEAKEEAPAEEAKEEAPAEEAKDEAPAEEAKDEAPAEEAKEAEQAE